MKKPRLKTIVGLGAGVVLLSVGLLVAFWLLPSVLVIHPPRSGWKSITVDGNPLTTTSPAGVNVFVPSDGRLCVSPIIYGYHTVVVKFNDGQAVSALFFHSNTGEDRRVDISIARSPGSQMVQVREVINWHEVIFSGNIRCQRKRQPDPVEIEGV